MTTRAAQEELARQVLRDPAVSALLAGLDQPGEETRIVGGALRNALMGLPAKDIDLATTLAPAAVSRLGAAAGWHVVPTGIEHGTLTLAREGRAFEVTTLREDVDTDGRRAIVRFGRDFRADAARRDFTMNALSMGRDGVLHDYFGGLADIARRKVCFIGEPEARLREDYLRGLRFFRFSAAYGEGRLDPPGLAAVLAHREGFARLSRERVRQEILALLMAKHAVPVLEAAEARGLISGVIGLAVDVGRLAARLDLAGRTGEAEVSAIARLAALAIGATDEAAIPPLREALRLTNAEERFLTRLAEAEHLFGTVGNLQISGGLAIFHLGDRYADVAPEVLRRRAVDTGDESILMQVPAVENPPVFLLTGKDILALGVPAGPRVGEALARAKTAWAHRGCPADRDVQARILADIVAAAGQADG